MITRKIVNSIKRFASNLLPEESISRSKEKWNKLAEENSRFVIASRLGEGITEDQFKTMGVEQYEELVKRDPLLIERLEPFSNKEVLEVGCGTGRMTEFFASDFKHIVGIDISEEMIKQGQERLAGFKNIELMVTDGLNYPFPDNHFDFVFSFIVFQHMPNKEVVLQNFREVFRVLKPGQIAKVQIRGGHQPFKWQWFHGPAFKKEEGVAMVEKVGFKVLKTEGENQKLFWLWLTK